MDGSVWTHRNGKYGSAWLHFGFPTHSTPTRFAQFGISGVPYLSNKQNFPNIILHKTKPSEILHTKKHIVVWHLHFKYQKFCFHSPKYLSSHTWSFLIGSYNFHCALVQKSRCYKVGDWQQCEFWKGGFVSNRAIQSSFWKITLSWTWILCSTFWLN